MREYPCFTLERTVIIDIMYGHLQLSQSSITINWTGWAGRDFEDHNLKLSWVSFWWMIGNGRSINNKFSDICLYWFILLWISNSSLIMNFIVILVDLKSQPQNLCLISFGSLVKCWLVYVLIIISVSLKITRHLRILC